MSKRRSSLPPNLIIKAGRWGWETVWHVMMSQMAPRNKSGAYVRPESAFRHRIGDGANSKHGNTDAQYPAAAGRYRLFVGMSCPWAHRTLVVLALKGLEDAIAITRVSPSPEAGGWIFDEPFQPQPDVACQSLAQFYAQTQPGYSGRNTVPVLWDSETNTIVNNESSEIIVILNEAFNDCGGSADVDLYPKALRGSIDDWNEKIYPAINNGVYRCGFAQTQAAYDEAVNALFGMLDEIDGVLASQRYLCGSQLTLADIRLFTTLIRFDVAYFGIFKCDRRRIVEYPHLSGYLRDIYQLPGVADTCDIPAVKRDYYGNLFPLNPGGIVPTGPDLSHLMQPHGRETVINAAQ